TLAQTISRLRVGSLVREVTIGANGRKGRNSPERQRRGGVTPALAQHHPGAGATSPRRWRNITPALAQPHPGAGATSPRRWRNIPPALALRAGALIISAASPWPTP